MPGAVFDQRCDAGIPDVAGVSVVVFFAPMRQWGLMEPPAR